MCPTFIILLKNLTWAKRDQMWMLNFWGILGGGGFTVEIMRLHVNCESWILYGGFRFDIIRVHVNFESWNMFIESACELWIPGGEDSQLQIMNPGRGVFTIDILCAPWKYTMWIRPPPQDSHFIIYNSRASWEDYVDPYLRAKDGVAISIVVRHSYVEGLIQEYVAIVPAVFSFVSRSVKGSSSMGGHVTATTK